LPPAAIADTLTQVRVKFYDVLLAIEVIKVNEASVKLLENELQDSERRFKADVVPRFNVLRAEVQLANAKPL
jgi:outer membrane protein TolC